MSIAMPSVGMERSLHRIRRDDLAAGLVREQVDRVRRVVPQQVVGPRARLAQRVHVRAAEEVGLHVHLLDVELARADLPVHPLVARVEAARVADHRDLAGGLLRRSTRLGVREAVGERDLDLHVLARREAGDRLRGVHLRGRAQDHRVDVRQREAVGEIVGDVADAVLAPRPPSSSRARGPRPRRTSTPSISRDRVEVLGAERAGAGERDDRLSCDACHRAALQRFAHRRILQDQVARRRCSTPGRGRSGARRAAARPPCAPRVISHMTSSMPSDPASRT